MSAPQARPRLKRIKAPRRHGTDTNATETWEQLRRAILEIQNENAARLSFEENYRYAYNLVLWKHGTMLYDGCIQLVAEFLDRMTREIIEPAFISAGTAESFTRGQEGERLVKAVRKVWDKHNDSMKKLGDIVKYMDRVHTTAEGVPPIDVAGRQLFIQHVLRSKRVSVQQRVVEAILGQIRVERDGYTINRSAVRSCVDIYLQLAITRSPQRLYAEDIEPDFLADSQKFYEIEAERLLALGNASEFLIRAEERLDSEESRVNHYLAHSTATELRKIVERNLLAPHLETILEIPGSGFETMIEQDRMDDLQRVYRLFVQVSTEKGPQVLKTALREAITSRGRIMNESAEGVVQKEGEGGEGEDLTKKGPGKKPSGAQTLETALKWVQDSLDLKAKFDKILTVAFDSDKGMQTAIIEALGVVVNDNNRSAEYISLFIDENLKKGIKGKSDDEIEAILDRTITLFRFVTDKDAFERYYKAHLAKRLLLHRSVSDDAERGMLAKLKVECGYQFTKKMEGMFQDMKVSDDTTKAYKDYLLKTQAPSVELTVTVMTSTFWPVSQHNGPTCVFPKELLQACNSFDYYYNTRHSGRKLTWQPAYGNADVLTRFTARTHLLNVSTYALVILLQFQDLGEEDFLTYEELKRNTGIPDVELQRHLLSLACAKFKVLKKHPPSKEVSVEDSFSFNEGFTANLQRIKISTIASRVETNEERRETQEKIEEERKHQTDACIVRVMKDRKTLGHNELVNEVTRLLANRFSPNPVMIKRRIESLIEKEYLERRPDKRSYNYLA